MKKYNKPTMTIIFFETKDIITVSDPLTCENTYDVTENNKGGWFTGD